MIRVSDFASFTKRAALYLVLGTLGNGCAYSVHQVYVSDFTPYKKLEQGNVVQGYGEQFVVMGFTTETDYVNTARTQLMNKCKSGNISGITTQLSTALGFFSWTNKALMQGLCVEARTADTGAAPSGKKRKPAPRT